MEAPGLVVASVLLCAELGIACQLVLVNTAQSVGGVLEGLVLAAVPGCQEGQDVTVHLCKLGGVVWLTV